MTSLETRPPPFVWKMQTGETISVKEMRTSHLFYVVRMIFNHSAPPVYQIPGCRSYNGPQRWTLNRRRRAVKAMLDELAVRSSADLAPWMWQQLEHMRDACKTALYLENKSN
jgi:hypothetical protein